MDEGDDLYMPLRMDISPLILVYDAISAAIEAEKKLHCVDKFGAAMNIAPIIAGWAEYLEGGMWPPEIPTTYAPPAAGGEA